jgi:hypothetical protein
VSFAEGEFPAELVVMAVGIRQYGLAKAGLHCDASWPPTPEP